MVVNLRNAMLHQSETLFVGERVVQIPGVCGQAFSPLPFTLLPFLALTPKMLQTCGITHGNASYTGYLIGWYVGG